LGGQRRKMDTLTQKALAESLASSQGMGGCTTDRKTLRPMNVEQSVGNYTRTPIRDEKS